jgi:hypothetical protein
MLSVCSRERLLAARHAPTQTARRPIALHGPRNRVACEPARFNLRRARQVPAPILGRRARGRPAIAIHTRQEPSCIASLQRLTDRAGLIVDATGPQGRERPPQWVGHGLDARSTVRAADGRRGGFGASPRSFQSRPAPRAERRHKVQQRPTSCPGIGSGGAADV